MNKILDIATQARQWAQVNRARYHSDYYLTGMCGVSSAYLLEHLHDAGINAVIACHDRHAWVEYSNYTIDVTATQFDDVYPPIMVVTSKELNKLILNSRTRENWWNKHFAFEKSKDFIEHQKTMGWPSSQIYCNSKTFSRNC